MSRDWLTKEEQRAYWRDKIIEECARVAESYETLVVGTAWIIDGPTTKRDIVAAIRALKDKS